MLFFFTFFIFFSIHSSLRNRHSTTKLTSLILFSLPIQQYHQQLNLTVCETELLATTLAVNTNIVPFTVAPLSNFHIVIVAAQVKVGPKQF